MTTVRRLTLLRCHVCGLRLGLGVVSDRSAQDERRCCVRQKRVVLAPVAGAKLAEAVRNPTGFDRLPPARAALLD
jgi:hypothetical protein